MNSGTSIQNVKALLFDVFGTVVDWRTGVSGTVEHVMAAQGGDVDAVEFAESWRAKYQPAMEPIRSGRRAYVALEILHRENLDTTLAEFGIGERIDGDARDRLNLAWEALPPWPDSVAGLAALKEMYSIASCSNGSIALMRNLAAFAGLPWDQILGADIAKTYKPRPEVYLKSVEVLGLKPEQAMMVAAHNDDLAAAREAGLATAFVPRIREYGPRQSTDLRAAEDWEVEAPDLVALADVLRGHL